MTGHRHHRPGAPDQRLPRLQPTEAAVLTVARHFFQSFARPETEGWLAAFDHAARFFGAEDGPRIAISVLQSVQRMREARRSCFHFSNPDCPHCAEVIGESERHFIGAFRGMAHGRLSEAYGHALILCEGHDADPLLAEMRRLAGLLLDRDPQPMAAAAGLH
ncbi:hypothetical protein [Paracoccus siganidrum]|nr:hypothetical protein [Paracoccus siganidrum]